MRRARQTAEVLAEALSCTVATVPGLREFNGTLAIEERPFSVSTAIPEGVSIFDWRQAEHGETWREFHQRVCRCMQELEEAASDDHEVVAVVHGGTLSNIVVWWLGLELDSLPDRSPFAASPGSLTVLDTNTFGKHTVDRLNDCCHLHESRSRKVP
jgi:broad specificity phosphatase PhoE